MFTEKTKKIITLLMLLTMALFTRQPALARGGGGFSGSGFGGGEGNFRGGNSMGRFDGGSFRSSGVSHFSRGGFNREFRTSGTVNRSFAAGKSNRSFNGGTFFDSPRSENFDRGVNSRGFDRGQGRFDGGHSGGDRFEHHRFDRDDRFFHNHFFFNPFFVGCFYDPFFESGIFLNPCYNGYVYGDPFYWDGYGPDYGDYPNNYNTYNYYYSNPDTTLPNTGTGIYNQIRPDSQPGQTDTDFGDGVKAFKSGDYLTAAAKFDSAMKQSPKDKVLPFAYAQAVFAGGNYTQAAAAVRDAVAGVNPGTEGIFFPRGLYSSDSEINRQIVNLSQAALINGKDTNLQLLLGYNWLGMGHLGKAKLALGTVVDDQINGPTAKALLQLIYKLQTPTTQTPTTVTPKTETPEVETAPQTPPAEAPQDGASAVEDPIG